jgi:ribosomal protein L37AE/L43A
LRDIIQVLEENKGNELQINSTKKVIELLKWTIGEPSEYEKIYINLRVRKKALVEEYERSLKRCPICGLALTRTITDPVYKCLKCDAQQKQGEK